MNLKPVLVLLVVLFVTASVFTLNIWQEKSFAAVESRDQEIARMAEGLRSKLVEQRRDFHVNPELSNREERTARV